ncbi:MAG: hypothetical protein II885_05880 [Oscillospiraceae bacterium]|nr:hypothetical protein [Oscillospiraceae bacterium]
MCPSLFNTRDADEYFASRLDEVSEKIERMNDSEITNTELSEWKTYYYELFKAHPIVLFEDSIIQTLQETKIKQRNLYRFINEPEFFYIDGVTIMYKIPFDGDSDLLYLTPSSYLVTKIDFELIIDATDTEYGYIIYKNEFIRSELEKHNNDMQEFVKNCFNKNFENHRKMIGFINSDADRYNKSLETTVEKDLAARFARAKSMSNISQKLSIPLYVSKDAPNSKPIIMKKIAKPAIQKPQKKTLPVEYSIRDEDYANINNIIYMCGTSMEKTARSHINNDEEELRDFILATLNTHYENASGETFRKVGKTDIHILFENQAAFIGECKVWHGEKVFTEAIQQLCSYSTWKDTKVTLVIFNKENKNFMSILHRIEDWVNNSTKAHSHSAANRWDCTYYRKDMETDIKLHIVVFDLHVKGT